MVVAVVAMVLAEVMTVVEVTVVVMVAVVEVMVVVMFVVGDNSDLMVTARVVLVVVVVEVIMVIEMASDGGGGDGSLCGSSGRGFLSALTGYICSHPRPFAPATSMVRLPIQNSFCN
ncbi:hypothetical protein U0070_006143 [Myodes glareolus]|uniref:Secreted protein n=1 Tax=Myodes glareolus TaxID=447135 RepID=A0AAW0I4M6_MYOGA